MGDGIAGEYSGLRLAVCADVVGEVATGTKNDLDRVPKPAEVKTSATTSYQAEPAPERRIGRALEARLAGQTLRDTGGALKELADGRLVFQYALVDLDAVERREPASSRERLKRTEVALRCGRRRGHR